MSRRSDYDNQVEMMMEEPPSYEEWATERSEIEVAAALREQAAKNYGSLIATVSSSYSRSLGQLETELNTRKRKADPQASMVSVIDPDKVKIGQHLQLSNEDIFKEVITQKGVPVDKVVDLGTLAPHYVSTKVITTDGKKVPYVMPVSNYVNTFVVPGLSSSVGVKYVNKHEGYHALDDKFIAERDALDNTSGPIYRPDSEKLLSDQNYLKASVLTQRSEGFADVGSLGDLVQEGETPEILSAVAEERKNSTDFGHQTAPILEGFKDRIEMMGVDEFRQLSQEEAVDFYKNTVTTYSITPEQMTLAAKLNLYNSKINQHVAKEKAREENNLNDDEIAAAQAYAPYLDNTRKSYSPVQKKELTPGEQLEIDNLKIDMKNRAFAEGGVITPETISQSFVKMMDETREADGMDSPKLDLITQAYDAKVSYIAENHARGVNIFDQNQMDIAPESREFHPQYLKTVKMTR